MPVEVPSDWEKSTLGAVSTVKARIGWRGLSSDEYTPSGPFLVAGKHIRDGVIDWDRCDHLSEFRYDQSPEIQLQDGDVILSKDGSIGNPALISSLPGPATINGTMMLVRAQREHLDPAYLYQVVRGNEFAGMIREKVSGSSIPHIFQRDIVHFPVVLPSLDEQRRIAEVLRSVDEAIAANRATIDMARRTLEALATEIATEASATRTVADFGRVITGGTPSPKNTELWDGELPFVTPGDLDDECISVRSAARSLNASAPHGARVLPANSVLVTCIGSTVGKVAISRRECATNQQINAISCDPELAGYVYLACLAVYDDILANAGKQAVPIINKSTLSGLALPYFPRERMREISEAVDALDDEREQSVAAFDRLTSMKASLMSDLLSGRVRVPA